MRFFIPQSIVPPRNARQTLVAWTDDTSGACGRDVARAVARSRPGKTEVVGAAPAGSHARRVRDETNSGSRERSAHVRRDRLQGFDPPDAVSQPGGQGAFDRKASLHPRTEPGDVEQAPGEPDEPSVDGRLHLTPH